MLAMLNNQIILDFVHQMVSSSFWPVVDKNDHGLFSHLPQTHGNKWIGFPLVSAPSRFSSTRILWQWIIVSTKLINSWRSHSDIKHKNTWISNPKNYVNNLLFKIHVSFSFSHFIRKQPKTHTKQLFSSKFFFSHRFFLSIFYI